MNELPGIAMQRAPDRLNRIEIPSQWNKQLEPIRPFANNLTMFLGTSGTGRDSLLEGVLQRDSSYQ